MNTINLTTAQKQRGLGALVGAAAGDALGAPFEFKPAGTYLATFPSPVLGGCGEMIGGGSFGWKPGEFTDDTQMALALAESLIASNLEFDPERTWQHFTAWAEGASDIGITTRSTLSKSDWRTAAELAHRELGRSASNGSVMRIAPIGIAAVLWNTETTVRIAREQSALTHFDPVAGWSAAIAAELIRRLIIGEDFTSALASVIAVVDDEHRAQFEHLLSPEWNPSAPGTPSNGNAIICLAQAIHAVASTQSFEDAVAAAVNFGDDADTVAAVTGAIAGARYGIQRIPSRWSTPLNGSLNGVHGKRISYRGFDLRQLAYALMGGTERPETDPEPAAGPQEVHEMGVHAANLAGAMRSSADHAVVSLCRTADWFADRPHHREIYMIDKTGNYNPSLHAAVTDAVQSIEAFLQEGRQVVVHCHGGRSRTGLVLKAWYMRRYEASHEDAHDWLDRCWPLYSQWNHEFTAFLEDEWERTIRN